MKRNTNIFLLSFCVMLLVSSVAYSQKTPPPPGPPPPPGLPIDAGLPYLFISGLAYGLYVLKKKR